LARNGTKWREKSKNHAYNFAAMQTSKQVIMGADKKQVQEPEQGTSKLFYFLLAGSVLLCFVLFKNLVFESDEPEPKLSPKEEEKLLKRLREIDESEQYALIALSDGWYPCLHSGRTSYYLKKGEVWKYGVTSKGKKGRYTTDYLVKNRVVYFVQSIGTFSECLKEEQIKLYYYPHLPENLARPPAERLPRPPYNSKKQ